MIQTLYFVQIAVFLLGEQMRVSVFSGVNLSDKQRLEPAVFAERYEAPVVSRKEMKIQRLDSVGAFSTLPCCLLSNSISLESTWRFVPSVYLSCCLYTAPASIVHNKLPADQIQTSFSFGGEILWFHSRKKRASYLCTRISKTFRLIQTNVNT